MSSAQINFQLTNIGRSTAFVLGGLDLAVTHLQLGSGHVTVDGLLIDLELVLLDGVEGADNTQGLPDLPPSVDNNFNITQPEEKTRPGNTGFFVPEI